MSTIVCACASEQCALFGCQRVASMQQKYLSVIAQAPAMNPCNCIGPQNGQPRCPCQMRGIEKRNGRWIQREVDLGPAA